MKSKNKILLEKYKKSILKDNDFSDLKLSLFLNKEESGKILSRINHDAKFLQAYNVTDYSLLLSIHNFTKEEYETHKHNPRIFKSKDANFLYNLSIIDFLSVKIN